MRTHEAVEKVTETRTRYRVSQDLGCAPILVSHWLRGTKMGTQYRELFEQVYGITINDNPMEASSNYS